MVEKGVPSGRSGGVVDSSDGENHLSAVATEAAEHPQNIRRTLEAWKAENQEKIEKMMEENVMMNKLLKELEKSDSE